MSPETKKIILSYAADEKNKANHELSEMRKAGDFTSTAYKFMVTKLMKANQVIVEVNDL